MLHNGVGKIPEVYQNSLEETTQSGPYFDKTASRNVTALLGKTTYLNCRVKNLGNKTVSVLEIIYPSFGQESRDKSRVNNN